jgi:DNA-binding NarL/FixJ family response regulator
MLETAGIDRVGEQMSLTVFIVDPHSIYRRGLVGCVNTMETVSEIVEAGSVEEAMTHPALADCDVLVIDHGLPGSYDFTRRVSDEHGVRVVACSSRSDVEDVLVAVQAGAVGYLFKETLTPELLVHGIRAAADGAGVMAPDLLGALLRGISRVSREVLEPRGLSLSRLTAREQEVLRLVALLQRAHDQERHPRRRDEAERADAVTGGRPRSSRRADLADNHSVGTTRNPSSRSLRTGLTAATANASKLMSLSVAWS